MRALRIVIVSGLSGSGKSNAIRVFEDLAFYCVDNLPPPLVPTFAELCAQSDRDINQVALGMDIRERGFLQGFPKMLSVLRKAGHRVELIFLEASDEVLLRRYSETRRPHPLREDLPLEEGIARERQMLADVKQEADLIIDTSDYHVHQLRDVLQEYYQSRGMQNPLRITVVSFGFKFGIPPDVDLIFDVRFLPNPHFVDELKDLTGNDGPVMDYIFRREEAAAFMDKFLEFLGFIIPLYQREGKSYLTMGVGCTGGRHRSVAVTNRVKAFLETKGIGVHLRHRDVGEPTLGGHV